MFKTVLLSFTLPGTMAADPCKSASGLLSALKPKTSEGDPPVQPAGGQNPASQPETQHKESKFKDNLMFVGCFTWHIRILLLLMPDETCSQSLAVVSDVMTTWTGARLSAEPKEKDQPTLLNMQFHILGRNMIESAFLWLVLVSNWGSKTKL